MGLIAGAPWGHLTQGGRVQGPLPKSGRIAALVSIFILAGMIVVVAAKGGLIRLDLPGWAGWVALTIQSLSMVANWATPSVPERRLWAPIVTTMFACMAITILLN
ncbi:hypothetical protein [Pseudoprimorskyibacter insulae]|uniref:hypothetical protein n=1 Tax=Pseudoprimorskyibacter insulae TaxID=1695997 RepID=UPI001FE852FB|nr:hypothetical protein [Pseudoprimorskyibacter insulae]